MADANTTKAEIEAMVKVLSETSDELSLLFQLLTKDPLSSCGLISWTQFEEANGSDKLKTQHKSSTPHKNSFSFDSVPQQARGLLKDLISQSGLKLSREREGYFSLYINEGEVFEETLTLGNLHKLRELVTEKVANLSPTGLNAKQTATVSSLNKVISQQTDPASLAKVIEQLPQEQQDALKAAVALLGKSKAVEAAPAATVPTAKDLEIQ